MEISYAGSIAHIAKINGESRVQPVSVHCRNTANYARQSAQCIGLGETAYLAGLLHDMGKCKSEFREYIINSSGGESVRRGTVNHTFAGVIFLFERYHSGDVLRQLTCEILSFAIASHHGLIDGVSPEFDNGFLHRLEKDCSEIHYEESRDNFLKECAELDELDNLFDKACNEVTLLYNAATSYIANSSDIGKSFKGKTRCFFVGMMARLVLSSVIDGDRRDTAEFDEGKLHKFIVADKQFWQERFDHFENKYKNDVLETAPDTLINRVRSYISDTAVKFAENSGSSGIYRLTVGTGSGKTLSSLRFSLKCAQTHNKKRIIFVIPLLSILEQNAAEIKRFIDRSDIVLEHHSNVIKEGFADDAEQLNSYELLAESWDSPIIITTLVQLLNALFSGKTTAVRRLQALCNSVIVIDEVQSVPRKLMYMFNLAVDYLAKFCGCTILLSSATQPCFEKMEYPIILSENASIVEETEEMRKAFKRTEIIDKVDKYGMSIEELVDFARDVISDCSSLLVICNKKSTAQELFSQLSFAKNDNFNLYHLSTSMCMQHRRDTLDNIKSDLAAKDGRKTLCVSTQLVEAGVDFSFESCIRLEAGLDNIAQAAGRCNRNGEFGKICNVYVVRLKSESLKRLPDISQSQTAYNAFSQVYVNNREEYGDILSEKSVELFYKKLMDDDNVKKICVYPIKNYKTNMLELLSDNYTYSKGESKTYLNQAFKTAGKEFSVFEDDTTDVVVPYNEEGKHIIEELFSSRAKNDSEYFKKLITQAKQYTISLFDYQLKNKDMFYTDEDNRFVALKKQYYDKNTGFDANGSADESIY